MDDAGALKLLLRKEEINEDSDPDALKLVKQLNFLPLAIELAGAVLRNDPKLTAGEYLYGNQNPGILEDQIMELQKCISPEAVNQHTLSNTQRPS
ncbi:uncharacterized protein VTP21DRAFT_9603 [Calcarisporiella thermophila]|uniref:uncharacterized protein n=1 Tax=Calcarisporiella thermophila TaxID=911321 RepID=UPI003742F8E6